MRRQVRAIAITILFAAAAATVGTNSPTATPPEVGTLKGLIRDARTGEPVVYANVLVVGTIRGTMTLEDGSFTIDGVPVGVCEVRVMMMGYRTLALDSVVVRASGETVLSDVIALAPRPRSEWLRITHHHPHPSWFERQYPCTYEFGWNVLQPATMSSVELTSDDVDLLATFFKEVAVTSILGFGVSCQMTSPLPVLLLTRGGKVHDPADSFFKEISTDSLRAIRAESRWNEPIHCVLRVTQRVHPDTLEVEAGLYCGDYGYGRRALAMRSAGRWEFCLNETVFGSVSCKPAVSVEPQEPTNR